MWLVGGIYGYGYNVWVWLVGVVLRYIDILIIIINFTYSTCIRSFFGSSILTSLFIFKCFFGLVYIYMTKIFRRCTISVGLALLANKYIYQESQICTISYCARFARSIMAPHDQ